MSEELLDVPVIAMPADIDNIPFDLLLGDDIGSLLLGRRLHRTLRYILLILLLGDDIDVNGVDALTTNNSGKEKNVSYSVSDLWDIVENQKLMTPFSKSLFPMHLLDLCPNDYESLKSMPELEQQNIAPLWEVSSAPTMTSNFFYSRILGCMVTPKAEKKFKRYILSLIFSLIIALPHKPNHLFEQKINPERCECIQPQLRRLFGH